MSYAALGAIGEFIAGLATVITLVYLVFQIRLNNAVYSGKDTTFAFLESSPKYPLILDALEKFGGTMIPFSGKSEGEFGFDIFVPLF